MKILNYILLCMLLAGVSCQDNDPPDDTPIPLNGTTWKLAGSVNAETGILKEFEPTACAECFTLTFNSDHEASGHSIIMDVEIDLLNLDPTKPIQKIYYDEGGYPDGHDFRMAIFWAESFTVTHKELKLYYNNKNNKAEYLLFKRI
ncbi:MAG: hypothetical protein LBL58_11145 [Tannerellaceae bacterium]|jgi:hypothetical protein|nr:hypothetical protein [Tannerellaceae bacterium]